MEIQSRSTLKTAAQYIKKGYVAPFPLPAGGKTPPAKGFTGNVPAIRGDALRKVWKDITEDDNANMALRLQVDSEKPFDIISIDVDDYGDKHGSDNIAKLENQLGSLNRSEIPRSSRRGADSMSGQHFFRVPKGIKWEGKVCADVEVVQLTHRYAAVWPSVVPDAETGTPLQYKWYVGEEEIDIPDVEDLPALPERWVSHLRKGSVKLSLKAREETFTGNNRYDKAIKWLSEILPGWSGGSRDMSKTLIQASTGDEVFTELSGNAHDTMVSSVHQIIRLGVEGHKGVEEALGNIQSAFEGELTSRLTNGRSRAEAEREFQDAVVGEVESLYDEINSGFVKVSESLDSLAAPSLQEALVSNATANKPARVDWAEYGNNDSDHARMFHDYWGNECLATEDRGSHEFVLWDKNAGRFVWKRRDEMFEAFRAAVPNRLLLASKEQRAEADRIAVKMKAGQVEAEDEERMEDAESIANNLKKRAEDLLNTRPIENVLKQLHSIEGVSIREGELDNIRTLIGIDEGVTLDINAVKYGDPEEYLRPSKPSDWLTMSTRVTLQEGATHPAWDDFLRRILPDEEIRTFVRKAMGYALADGNPEKLAIFLSGESNTGKSTILLACQAALGDYASPMQTSKIYGRSQDGPTPEIIANIDKLMVTMSETGDGDTLSSNAIKQITGNDQLQLRGAHKNETINKSPRFVPYSSTNSPPKVTDADKALQGRILVLPFDYPQKPGVVGVEEDVVNNPEISLAVLAWMFEGYKDFVREGIGKDTWPKEIKDKSQLFTNTTNTIVQFVQERLTHHGDKKKYIEGDKLYLLWKQWAVNEGLSDREMNISKTSFYQKIKSNAYPIVINTRIDGKTVTVLRGYSVK